MARGPTAGGQAAARGPRPAARQPRRRGGRGEAAGAGGVPRRGGRRPGSPGAGAAARLLAPEGCRDEVAGGQEARARAGSEATARWPAAGGQEARAGWAAARQPVPAGWPRRGSRRRRPGSPRSGGERGHGEVACGRRRGTGRGWGEATTRVRPAADEQLNEKSLLKLSLNCVLLIPNVKTSFI
ncbi:translation initiation factor IF-2-like [Panicum virgatum]|uniref:translation initiation factor IF-2-like n=1 Tax=Panicum virgatum TaxID=38727 RepID=UPI0019D50820|nr:translation initiation factor IF-2-like [Panicum virgatum]